MLGTVVSHQASCLVLALGNCGIARTLLGQLHTKLNRPCQRMSTLEERIKKVALLSPDSCAMRAELMRWDVNDIRKAARARPDIPSNNVSFTMDDGSKRNVAKPEVVSMLVESLIAAPALHSDMKLFEIVFHALAPLYSDRVQADIEVMNNLKHQLYPDGIRSIAGLLKKPSWLVEFVQLLEANPGARRSGEDLFKVLATLAMRMGNVVNEAEVENLDQQGVARFLGPVSLYRLGVAEKEKTLKPGPLDHDCRITQSIKGFYLHHASPTHQDASFCAQPLCRCHFFFTLPVPNEFPLARDLGRNLHT